MTPAGPDDRRQAEGARPAVPQWSAHIALVVSLLWPPLLVAIVLKVFPDLVGKALFKAVEHRSEARLARLRDELGRDTAVHVETLKADLQAAQSALKTSVDFLSASQSGLRAEAVASVRSLWKSMLELRKEFAGLTVYQTIFTRAEIAEIFAGGDRAGVLGFMGKYRDEQALYSSAGDFARPKQEEARLFVGDRLWLVYTAIRVMLFRLALLTFRSLKDRRFHDWRADTAINQVLLNVLPGEIVAAAKAQEGQGMQSIIGHLEAEFLHEANRVMSGSKAFADSLSDMNATLLLQSQRAAEQRTSVRGG